MPSSFDFRAESYVETLRRGMGFYRKTHRVAVFSTSSQKAWSLPKSPISGMHANRQQAHFFSHVIPRRIAVANVRRVDARKKAKAATPAEPADNDWWSWALIAVIIAISAAAVWGPVIAGAI
jgi:hypothetical protein